MNACAMSIRSKGSRWWGGRAAAREARQNRVPCGCGPRRIRRGACAEVALRLRSREALRQASCARPAAAPWPAVREAPRGSKSRNCASVFAQCRRIRAAHPTAVLKRWLAPPSWLRRFRLERSAFSRLRHGDHATGPLLGHPPPTRHRPRAQRGAFAVEVTPCRSGSANGRGSPPDRFGSSQARCQSGRSP